MTTDSPEARLRLALEMSEVGMQMMRTRLRRENPQRGDDEIQSAMESWLRNRPDAPFGDFPGGPSGRVLGDASR